MARTTSSFARKPAKYLPQKRALIICEDTKSCLLYLQDAAMHFRSYAEVEVSHCGKTDTIGIVKEAIKRKSAFDEVFCAVDRDAHEGFDEAMQLAATNGIGFMASYPCYEFWLLLHFRFTRAPCAREGTDSSGDVMVRWLRAHEEMSDYGKGDVKGLFEKLLPKLPTARKNAAAALKSVEVEGNPNPSTYIHMLIDKLEALGKLQEVTAEK